MTTSADFDANKEVFLQSLEVDESEFCRLLQWSVLPDDGFTVCEVEWLEECLGLQSSVSAESFLNACVEKSIIEPIDDGGDAGKQRFQLEVPWHRLVGDSSREVVKSAMEIFVDKTIEKLRRITIDFSSKDLYLKSCEDYDKFARLIFHALALVLLPDHHQRSMEEKFRRRLFANSFFGRVNDASIIGAFWYLQDRMQEEDRTLFLSIRDAMLEKVHWADHPALLSILIKLEKVLRFSKCSKKFGNVEERKPLLSECQQEFEMALSDYNMAQDYPCIMGYYYDVMLDIMEKAPIVDGTSRDRAWKAELRRLCGVSQEYWNKARLRLEGSEEQCHAIIHHIHALSKEAHLQMLAGEKNESDLKHELVLKEAEARYGDHKITATFASFYGDYYLRRDERRANATNKEDDYRRAMQFFMKEYRILQHCNVRDQTRVKINLGKQGYVKGLMAHGKEALVDAKKAYLMGEDVKDWRTEGSGFLRYNYLNVIFLHWMTLEDKKAMGTKWWMTRELRSLLLPEHHLSPLRESGSVLIPAGAGVKPNTHEELVHNLIMAVYRVQARPRLLSPRIHPGHHLFWSNVVEEYVASEDDQIIALEAVKVYMETGGVIVLRKRPHSPFPEKENVAPAGSATTTSVPQMTTALQKVDLNNNVADVADKMLLQDRDADDAEVPRKDSDGVSDSAADETRKLLDAVRLLTEAGIVNATVLGKWKVLKGIEGKLI